VVATATVEDRTPLFLKKAAGLDHCRIRHAARFIRQPAHRSRAGKINNRSGEIQRFIARACARCSIPGRSAKGPLRWMPTSSRQTAARAARLERRLPGVDPFSEYLVTNR